MSARFHTRALHALVAGLVLLLGVTLAETPAGAHQAGASADDTDRTGTVSSPLAQRRGKLGLSLASTADGRIKVKWGPTAHLANVKYYIVQVSPSRTMTHKMQAYRVSRRLSTKVVPHAFGVTRPSGNYSFVRVVAVRTSGARGGSLTKWIQAPVGVPCSAAPEDRVSVAAFNIRTWNADPQPGQPLHWDLRGPKVVAEILSSGARVVAIQEASGAANEGFGPKPQPQWVLDQLNATDPDVNAHWVDALTAKDYVPPKGRKPGHVGTRVFYDESKYTELAAGLARIIDPGVAKDSLVPWARLQSVSGTQAPFVFTSNHLALGTSSLADWEARGRQGAKTIDIARDLHNQFGDQVIVAGDLNSTANTKPYNNVHLAFMKAGFYDTYATTGVVGGDYPTTNESKFPMYRTPLRRDYILTLGPAKGGCGYRNQTYNLLSQLASDHFLQVSSVPLPPL